MWLEVSVARYSRLRPANDTNPATCSSRLQVQPKHPYTGLRNYAEEVSSAWASAARSGWVHSRLTNGSDSDRYVRGVNASVGTQPGVFQVGLPSTYVGSFSSLACNHHIYDGTWLTFRVRKRRGRLSL